MGGQRRTTERRLLWEALGITLLAFGLVFARQVMSEEPPQVGDGLLYLLFFASLYGLHKALCLLRVRGGEILLPWVTFLSGWGLVMKFRLRFLTFEYLGTPRVLVYPLAAAATVLVLLLFRRYRLRGLQRAHVLWAGLALGVMVVLLRYGSQFRGAYYGPFLTTPGEVVKVLLLLYLVGFLATHGEEFTTTWLGLPWARLRVLLSFLILWFTPQVLLLRQGDFGALIILGGLAVVMFYVATGQFSYLAWGTLLTGVAVVSICLLVPHAQARLLSWWDPWSDPQGRGWQTLQALFALRAGALDGRGLGAGFPELVPIVESDFIYAAFAEELGLLGSGLLVLAYWGLFRRGYQIATQAPEPFPALLATGCTSLLAIQALLNLGGVVKLLPITGLTLPFVSHGGTSLVVCFVLLGFLLAVADHLSATSQPQDAQ